MENTTKKSYYAIIPANVRYDRELNANAKLLYGEITALCNEKGFCWASNTYFAELYGVTKITISRWISDLSKKGYIKSEVIRDKKTKEIQGRYISILTGVEPLEDVDPPIIKNDNRYYQNCIDPILKNDNTPIIKNDKDNNTDINNTLNNTINNNGDKKRKRFSPPTLEEVKAYCLERKNKVDPQRFIDYYTSNGWHVGKNKMKDWKAAVRTWERNVFANNTSVNANNTRGKNGIIIDEANTSKESADFWAQVRKDSGTNERN